MMLYYHTPISLTLIFVPVLLLIQVIFTVGISLLLAMANLFLRDVKYLLEMVLTVWMFATSVVYPMDLVGGRLGLILKLNPMTPIIDGFRSTILLGRWPSPLPLLLATVLAFASLVVGWLVFHRAEYRFAEYA